MKKEDIKIGKTYWLASWSIARSGSRINEYPKPVKVKITDLQELSSRYVSGYIGDSIKENPYIAYWELYETEEEIYSRFNRDIYFKIDEITEKYEKKLKYLKSKLYDTGGTRIT